MAMRRTPVVRTRKRRIFLIHPLGTLPTILDSLQNKLIATRYYFRVIEFFRVSSYVLLIIISEEVDRYVMFQVTGK